MQNLSGSDSNTAPQCPKTERDFAMPFCLAAILTPLVSTIRVSHRLAETLELQAHIQCQHESCVRIAQLSDLLP